MPDRRQVGPPEWSTIVACAQVVSWAPLPRRSFYAATLHKKIEDSMID
jgi:hypothetical protein